MPDINSTGFKFLMTDLAIGLGRARRASTERKAKSREQQIRNARHAYHASLRFAPRLQLNEMENEELKEKILELRVALEQLGEVL